MRLRSPLFAAMFGASAASWVAEAAAQDVSNLMEVLDENVVSGASRSAERSSDAPATSTTLTAEQLRHFGFQRLDEALSFLSLGMFSQERMSTSEVGARGVALTRDRNSHVLVVLDGMVMNEQGGGAVYFHDIPIEVIDHVEVILGPGSVLYGAQAMLGVINIVTKKGSDYRGVHLRTNVSASAPMNSSGNLTSPSRGLGWDARVAAGWGHSLSVLGKDTTITVSVDYADFKGPPITFAYQPSQGVDFGPNAKPGYWGGPVSNQWFRRTMGGFLRIDRDDLSWVTRVTGTTLGMPQMDLFENRVGGAYDDTRNHNEYITVLSNLRKSVRFSERMTGLGRLYGGYSQTQYARHVLQHSDLTPGVPLGVIDPEQCPAGPSGPCRKESVFLSRWLGSELQATYDWTGTGMYSTMVGIDGRLRTSAYEFVTFDDQTGQSYGSDPAQTRWHGGGYKVADEFAIGGYIQQLLRPWKYLALNVGTRVDYDSRVDAKYIPNAMAPRVAIISKPTERLTLKAIYSTAYRAPSFVELYVVSGRLLPNAEGLRPETVSSWEGIGSLRLGSHVLSVGGFYSRWNDLIELQIVKAQAPSVSRYGNVSAIDNFGGNLSYEGSLLDGHLKLGVNVTAAIAERKRTAQEIQRNPNDPGDSVPVTMAPQLFGNGRVSYGFGGETDQTLGVAASLLGRRIADQAYFGGDRSNLTPRPNAPEQLELRAFFTGRVPTWRWLGYSIGADYVFGSKQPYVVGPQQGMPSYLVPEPLTAQLAPVNRLTVSLGLQVDLDTSTQSQTKTAPAPVTEAVVQ